MTAATPLLISPWCAYLRAYLLPCNQLSLSIPVSGTTDNNIRALCRHDLHYAFTRLTACESLFTGAFLSSLTGVHHHPVPTVATQLLIAAKRAYLRAYLLSSYVLLCPKSENMRGV